MTDRSIFARAALGAAMSLFLSACGTWHPFGIGEPKHVTLSQVAAVPAPVNDVSWTQYAEKGLEVRAITAKPDCPLAIIDGKQKEMTLRAGPAPGFPGRVCALPLPKGTRTAFVGGTAVPLPSGHINKIMIFGDTGCRVKGNYVQACNDPNIWPFGKIAMLAATEHPDLVIHVGDYYYRESPCPAGVAGCAGTPYGDAWASWKADFFDPAAPLLASTPWVLARGNHEGCGRGAAGWFRFLDAGETPLACPAESAPLTVKLGGLNLYVLDSADTDDRTAPPDKVAAFAAQLKSIKAAQGSAPGWIITHRPVWGFVPVKVGPVMTHPELNATEQAAARKADLKGITMIVSGHVHNFESVTFGAKRPAQLVVGSGGDVQEEDQAPAPKHFKSSFGGIDADAFTFRQFGYLILDRKGNDWVGTFRGLNAHDIATCRLSGRDLTCRGSNVAPR